MGKVKVSMHGTKKRPRLVVFRSLKYMKIVLIGDKALTGILFSHQYELNSMGTELDFWRMLILILTRKQKCFLRNDTYVVS